MKKIVFILMSFSLICCKKDSLEDQFIGLWEIEKIVSSEKIVLTKYTGRVISFEENKVLIPNLKNSKLYGRWEINSYEKNDTIAIRSLNKLFDGNYDLTFSMNDELLLSKLISVDKEIILSKINLEIELP